MCGGEAEARFESVEVVREDVGGAGFARTGRAVVFHGVPHLE